MGESSSHVPVTNQTKWDDPQSTLRASRMQHLNPPRVTTFKHSPSFNTRILGWFWSEKWVYLEVGLFFDIYHVYHTYHIDRWMDRWIDRWIDLT